MMTVWLSFLSIRRPRPHSEHSFLEFYSLVQSSLRRSSGGAPAGRHLLSPPSPSLPPWVYSLWSIASFPPDSPLNRFSASPHSFSSSSLPPPPPPSASPAPPQWPEAAAASSAPPASGLYAARSAGWWHRGAPSAAPSPPSSCAGPVWTSRTRPLPSRSAFWENTWGRKCEEKLNYRREKLLIFTLNFTGHLAYRSWQEECFFSFWIFAATNQNSPVCIPFLLITSTMTKYAESSNHADSSFNTCFLSKRNVKTEKNKINSDERKNPANV